MGQKDRRKVKIALWTADPDCYWCGEPTVLICPIFKAPLPNNAATFDHIYANFDERRRFPSKSSTSQTVIACNACNHARSKIQNRLADRRIGPLYADQLLGIAPKK